MFCTAPGDVGGAGVVAGEALTARQQRQHLADIGFAGCDQGTLAGRGGDLLAAGALARCADEHAFGAVAIGQAVAFNSAPALLIVLTCVIPSFVWRALEEERVLVSVFGEPYISYRKQTKMIVPYVL